MNAFWKQPLLDTASQMLMKRFLFEMYRMIAVTNIGQNYQFFGTWTTLPQSLWLLFEWLVLLIKFAELKYRVIKVMALAFDLFITDWWWLTLVLWEQACVCIAYFVQPNLWKRFLPHEKHRHRHSHFNCTIIDV